MLGNPRSAGCLLRDRSPFSACFHPRRLRRVGALLFCRHQLAPAKSLLSHAIYLVLMSVRINWTTARMESMATVSFIYIYTNGSFYSALRSLAPCCQKAYYRSKSARRLGGTRLSGLLTNKDVCSLIDARRSMLLLTGNGSS